MTRPGKRRKLSRAHFEGIRKYQEDVGDFSFRHKQGRRHFGIGKMEVTSSSESAAKKHKNHEAQMIPGVDGQRTFGFPNSIITKLRYVDLITLTSTAGSLATNNYLANSIYDPNSTGVGHQPLYHDQYAAIYDQYVVLGSKITVHFQPYQVDQAWIFGIVGDDDVTISTTTETRMEQNNSVWTISGTNDSGPVVLSQTFSPLRDFGVDAKDDGASQTAVGSNPTEQIVFAVWAQELNTALTGTAYLAVDIEYTVKFSELKTPTQS